ncbi:hypothetical protein DOTSEDRAFT_74879 [Dothistroma septosporum NZE10]|uniref:Uncharacterized protein n=1 Tax=Dothistroma septosporum (strain NZE10 / CBS 128990) TaxID=675120 RepID=N1PDN9_DOTSN|nr:hypothetical protein DOTSEDRAFT_74879 [Dothistroma septosporum NZE10]
MLNASLAVSASRYSRSPIPDPSRMPASTFHTPSTPVPCASSSTTITTRGSPSGSGTWTRLEMHRRAQIKIHRRLNPLRQQTGSFCGDEESVYILTCECQCRSSVDASLRRWFGPIEDSRLQCVRCGKANIDSEGEDDMTV